VKEILPCIPIFIIALFIITKIKIWKLNKLSSVSEGIKKMWSVYTKDIAFKVKGNFVTLVNMDEPGVH
jgi:hypothetical protein